MLHLRLARRSWASQTACLHAPKDESTCLFSIPEFSLEDFTLIQNFSIRLIQKFDPTKILWGAHSTREHRSTHPIPSTPPLRSSFNKPISILIHYDEKSRSAVAPNVENYLTSVVTALPTSNELEEPTNALAHNLQLLDMDNQNHLLNDLHLLNGQPSNRLLNFLWLIRNWSARCD